MSARITIASLGHYGRFGNSLFQYAFAKAYARKYGAVLEVPADWIGRKLFYIDDPPITRQLRGIGHDVIPDGAVNIDLHGYFQSQKAIDHYTRKDAKEWFCFRDKWCNLIPERKESYTAAHVRRGDYSSLTNIYCLVSEMSYRNAFRKFGVDENNVVWLKEETQQPNPELDREGVGFLSDFFALIRANNIFRANSTFSWWGAVLSDAKIYSPVVGSLTGERDVEFVEGNYPAMVFGSHNDLHLKEGI